MLKYLVMTIVIFLQSTLAFSDGNSGTGNIDYLYQRSFDGLLAVQKVGGVWNNPDGCGSSSRIVLTRDNPSRSEFYSALLASKMANREISAWVSGCIDWNGVTYPIISGLTTY